MVTGIDKADTQARTHEHTQSHEEEGVAARGGNHGTSEMSSLNAWSTLGLGLDLDFIIEGVQKSINRKHEGDLMKIIIYIVLHL